MKFKRNEPYNDLRYLPPDKEIETVAVLKQVINTSRALAELNGSISSLTNPNLLLDFVHVKEAKDSSEIENIVTTTDAIYEAISANKKIENKAIKEVVTYKGALNTALETLASRPFINTNLCIKIMQTIRGTNDGIRTGNDTKLRGENGRTIYTPPAGESLIRDLMQNWEEFINQESELDPLIVLAITHYQFEAIHPFSDGNGRTGRIIMLLFLSMTGLLKFPAIYMSEFINENKDEYYTKLRRVTEEQEWEEWVLYILEMLRVTARISTVAITRILRLQADLLSSTKQKFPWYNEKISNLIFEKPYVKIWDLVDAKIGTRKTVGNYLKSLEKENILNSRKVGKERIYVNNILINELKKKSQMFQVI